MGVPRSYKFLMYCFAIRNIIPTYCWERVCRRDGLVVWCGVVTVTVFGVQNLPMSPLRRWYCTRFGGVFFAGFTGGCIHCNDAIMNTMASQNTTLTIVYSTVYSGADQRKHQSSASLAFVRVIHRGLVNSPHKWPVTQKMFPFDDVIIAFMAVASGWRRFSFQWITTELLMKPHRPTDTLSVIPLYGRTAIW